MPVEFEYQIQICADPTDVEWLNRLGNQGWQLAAIRDDRCIFQRPVQAPPARTLRDCAGQECANKPDNHALISKPARLENLTKDELIAIVRIQEQVWDSCRQATAQRERMRSLIQALLQQCNSLIHSLRAANLDVAPECVQTVTVADTIFNTIEEHLVGTPNGTPKH